MNNYRTQYPQTVNNYSQTNGVGFCGALFLVFLVLKLVGVIGWSWWWVTAPLWIPFCLALVLGLILFLTVWRQSE